MVKKSDSELLSIVQSDDYVDDAKLAAIHELENRKAGSDSIQKQKELITLKKEKENQNEPFKVNFEIDKFYVINLKDWKYIFSFSLLFFSLIFFIATFNNHKLINRYELYIYMLLSILWNFLFLRFYEKNEHKKIKFRTVISMIVIMSALVSVYVNSAYYIVYLRWEIDFIISYIVITLLLMTGHVIYRILLFIKYKIKHNESKFEDN